MIFFIIKSLYAQTSQQSQTGTSTIFMLFPYLVIFLIFYLLLIRPQIKQQKEHRKLLESLKKGDNVITQAGIVGTVVGFKSDFVEIKIAENVKIQVLKNSITKILKE